MTEIALKRLGSAQLLEILVYFYATTNLIDLLVHFSCYLIRCRRYISSLALISLLNMITLFHSQVSSVNLARLALTLALPACNVGM